MTIVENGGEAIPARRYAGGARAIGRVAAEITGKAFQRHGLGRGEIACAWPHLVGSALARVSRPERIQPARSGRRHGGTLHIAAAAPMTVEIAYAEGRIVEGVNALFGYEMISRIRVRAVDETDFASASDAAAARVGTPETADAEPADPDRLAAGGATSLRQALARLEAGIRADAAASRPNT